MLLEVRTYCTEKSEYQLTVILYQRRTMRDERRHVWRIQTAHEFRVIRRTQT